MDRVLSLREKLGRSIGGDSYNIRAIDRPLMVYHHQHSQPVFLVKIDSPPSPDTLLLFPSGIRVSGVESWVQKLADVA